MDGWLLTNEGSTRSIYVRSILMVEEWHVNDAYMDGRLSCNMNG